MNSTLYVLEEHVRAVRTRQLENALRVEQLRIARANQPTGISKAVSSIRLATGHALVRIGERLRNQSVPMTYPTPGKPVP